MIVPARRKAVYNAGAIGFSHVFYQVFSSLLKYYYILSLSSASHGFGQRIGAGCDGFPCTRLYPVTIRRSTSPTSFAAIEDQEDTAESASSGHTPSKTPADGPRGSESEYL